MKHWSFPGGSVVKNPLANPRDVGLILGPRRSHVLWSSEACVPQLLSLCSRDQKLQLLTPRALEPVLHRKEALTPQLESSPH